MAPPPRIAVPTLVLHGSDDLMVPGAKAKLITSRLPDATVQIHDGRRHGFFDEFAGDLARGIRAFLAGSEEHEAGAGR